jgi:hypothetical protein
MDAAGGLATDANAAEGAWNVIRTAVQPTGRSIQMSTCGGSNRDPSDHIWLRRKPPSTITAADGATTVVTELPNGQVTTIASDGSIRVKTDLADPRYGDQAPTMQWTVTTRGI